MFVDGAVNLPVVNFKGTGAYQRSMETKHLCLPDRTAAQTRTSRRPLHSRCTLMLQAKSALALQSV